MKTFAVSSYIIQNGLSLAQLSLYAYHYFAHILVLVGWLAGCVLLHINFGRLSNAKFIFI